MGFTNGEKGEEEMMRRAVSIDEAERRVQVRICYILSHHMDMYVTTLEIPEPTDMAKK